MSSLTSPSLYITTHVIFINEFLLTIPINIAVANNYYSPIKSFEKPPSNLLDPSLITTQSFHVRTSEKSSYILLSLNVYLNAKYIDAFIIGDNQNVMVPHLPYRSPATKCKFKKCSTTIKYLLLLCVSWNALEQNCYHCVEIDSTICLI